MKRQQLIERSSCAVTGERDLESLDRLPDFPIFMGCVDSPASHDVFADLCWSISRESGLIQLSKLIPLDVLYSESHGSGDVGRLWDSHHNEFANFIADNGSPQSVFEIGGAHGRLSREYIAKQKIPWTILEPNPMPVSGCPAQFIEGFFDEKFSHAGSFDTVIHSHVLEHIYKPMEFMRHLSDFMSAGKKLIFSVPNMYEMLARKYTNCINFEHTAFLTEPYIEYLLSQAGFRLLNKDYFMADHSIFYSAVRDNDIEPSALPQGLYEENKKLYLDYANYHEKLVKELNDRMSETSRPVYLFGAHVFSQHLLEMGLDASKIVSLLDNDSKKQGSRLYGSHLSVASPRVLSDVESPHVILKAGVYNNEIKNDILENINKSTQFLE